MSEGFGKARDQAGVAPFREGDVRQLYAAGTWRYALGRPGWEHPEYPRAVGMAERQGWNPWWIRAYHDVPAVLDGCWMDERSGHFVCGFMERFCRLSKGRWAGRRVQLMDWQRWDLLMPAFGWKREAEDTIRRYTLAALWVPKKNGKSPTCSMVGIVLLIADGEPGPEVYAVAGDREQAGIVHTESARMVRKSPELAKRLRVIESTKRILYPKQEGIFRALSADASLQEGLNWNGVIFDELHVQANRVLYDALIEGGSARLQPMWWEISTAGVYNPETIGWEEWERCKGVQAGTNRQPWVLPLIYAADPETDDWESPETIIKANPSIDITKPLARVQRSLQEAKDSPAKANSYKRYHLNIWTQASAVRYNMADWEACAFYIHKGLKPLVQAGETAAVEHEQGAEAPCLVARRDAWRLAMRGRECYAGADFSSKLDLTSLALVFPGRDASEPTRCWVYSWLPGDSVARRMHEDKVAYDRWIEDGWIERTSGNVIDHGFIRKRLRELREVYKLRQIGFDPYNASQVEVELVGDGFEMVELRQDYGTYTAPIKELERAMKSREIEHDGNPVVAWALNKMQVKVDAKENEMPDKRGTVGRIDPAVALLMAYKRMLVDWKKGRKKPGIW